jgi:hypothetical protein
MPTNESPAVPSGSPRSRAVAGGLTALLVVVALAACSGGDGGKTASPTPSATSPSSASASSSSADATALKVTDPCTLLTPEELGAAVGTPFGEGTPRVTDAAIALRTCSFASPGSTGRILTVEVATDDDLSEELRAAGQTIDKVFAAGRSLAANAGGTDLPGVGDGAYVSPRKAAVLANGTLVVLVAGLDGGDASAPLKTLITTVAGRL